MRKTFLTCLMLGLFTALSAQKTLSDNRALPDRSGLLTERVEEVGMSYPFGGPIGAVALNPLNHQHIIVAGETGGLFESKDRGATWKHLDEFRHYLVHDVQIMTAPGGFEVWAATGNAVLNTQGPLIWKRSVNGQWSQGSYRVSADRSSRPDDTYRIIRSNSTGRMYACGAFGVAIKDTGSQNTWTRLPFSDPGPVYSIECMNNGTLLAATRRGIYQSLPASGGNAWTLRAPSIAYWSEEFRFALRSDPTGSVAMAIRVNADTSNFILLVSTDFGQTWQPFQTSPGPCVKGAGGYVSISPLYDPERKTMRIFFSNRYEVSVADGPGPDPGQAVSAMQRNTRLSWATKLNKIPIGHDDTRQVFLLSMGLAKRTLMITSDGGIHFGSVNGDDPIGYDWQTVPTGTGLKNSQVTNVTGDGRLIYFGTWHTGFGASADGGRTVTSMANARELIFGGEGFVVPMRGAFGTYESHPIVGGDLKRSRKIFGLDNVDEVKWDSPAPADPRWGPIFIENGKYIQQIMGPDSNGKFSWKLTASGGRTWLDLGSTLYPRFGFGDFSASPSGARRFYYTVPVLEGQKARLAVLADYAPGLPPNWQYPSMNNMEGGLAGMSVGAIEAAVVTVSPFDRSRMIGVEFSTGKLKRSLDGGNNWTELNSFNAQFRTTGCLLRSAAGTNSIWALSYSPFNPDWVLLATLTEGVYVSKDNGNNWRKLNNPGILLPTFFYWHSAGRAFLATYGRGLFSINL